jgi:hypothetical protein
MFRINEWQNGRNLSNTRRYEISFRIFYDPNWKLKHVIGGKFRRKDRNYGKTRKKT